MDLMHDDPEEFLLRLQHQRSRDHRRGAALKGNEHAPRMNAYSRPVHSKNQPLRSSFLDPETNNFPRSKTKKELQRKKKLVNMPHMSYDIDGDGYVSQEDYFMAKRFDMDGNGVLDADERVGRAVANAQVHAVKDAPATGDPQLLLSSFFFFFFFLLLRI